MLIVFLIMYAIQFQLTMAYLKLISLNTVIDALDDGYIYQSFLLDNIAGKYIRYFNSNKHLMAAILLTPIFNICYIGCQHMKVKNEVLKDSNLYLPCMTQEEKMEYSNCDNKLKKILFLIKNKKEWDSREIDYDGFHEKMSEEKYNKEYNESKENCTCQIISYEEAKKNCDIDIDGFYENSIFNVDHDRNVINIDALRNKALLKKRTNRF